LKFYVLVGFNFSSLFLLLEVLLMLPIFSHGKLRQLSEFFPSNFIQWFRNSKSE
jgi:hypothetical protein